MKNVLLTFTIVGSVFVTPAFAGEIGPNTGHEWTGFYIGAQAGSQGIYDRWSAAPTLGPSFTNSNVYQNGLTGGLHAGYNHQTSWFVIGIEGDIEASGNAWNYSETRPDGFWAGTVWSSEAETNVQGSLRARIGLPVDRALIYGTAGLAYANVTHSYSDTSWKGVPLWEDNAHSFDNNLFGFTVGTGVDYALSDQLSTRVEYRFTDLGTVNNYNFGWDEVDSHDITSHAVRFGVSYHF